jgi:hypothetical protein
MPKAFSSRNWLVIAVFCAVAPFVFFYVDVYWSMLTIRALPLSVAKSEPLLMLWMFAANVVAATIAAFILAAPLAWLIGSRPFLLASLLALVTVAAALFQWQGTFTGVAAFLTYALLISFFLLCWLTARLVTYLLHRSGHAN